MTSSLSDTATTCGKSIKPPHSQLFQVESSHSGYLVPKDDVAALAKAMTCVLRSDDDQERIAQNALDRAQFMFSPEAYNRSIVELVSE